MKNLLWVLLAVVVMTILLLLSSRTEEVPHGYIQVDTTDQIEAGSGETGGSVPEMGYVAKSYKRQPSEDFLGKSYSTCIQMIYEWPDAQLYEMASGIDGIPFLDFSVNKHHHNLIFSNDICVQDERLDLENQPDSPDELSGKAHN